jgi:manganese-dependent inorganic pyrophosphatase
VDPKKVIEVIDHRLHRKARTAYPNAELAIEAVGAAATLIAERFRIHEVSPSSEAGMLLYGAIHSNTQCLRGSVTSHRDIEASKWLEDVAFIPDSLLEGQFAARKEEIMSDLAAAIVRESKRYEHESGPYVIAQLEFSGAGQLINGRLTDLTDYSRRLGARTMLNLVDIATGKSYLLVPNGDLRLTVSKLTGLNFKDLIAESNAVVLRKQILAGMEGIPWT